MTGRPIVQFVFLLVTIVGVFVVRGNAERWCPFGGVETLYTYATERNLVCSLGVSNLYMLAATLLLAVLLRRVFCGYVCPIGTISEWLQRVARRLGLRPSRVPDRVDRGLSMLKYVALAPILAFTWRSGELVFRGYDPCYALISRHGEDIKLWAYLIAAGIALASLVWLVPFCRWLCPLAAVLNPLSRFGLARVKRRCDKCTGCRACAEACPMAIPVDRLDQVTAARCTACLECVGACPAADASALEWGPPARLGRRWPHGILIASVLIGISAPVAATYAFPLPSFAWVRGTPPPEPARLNLRVEGLTCRGRANLLVYFLDRDDELGVAGYLKVQAWPGPGLSAAAISFDPAVADEHTIKQALTEPYYDLVAGVWRHCPFRIAGYDPLNSDW